MKNSLIWATVLRGSNPCLLTTVRSLLGLAQRPITFLLPLNAQGIVKWEPQLKQRGLSYGKMMARLPWDQPIPFDLLRDVIAFNIDDKRDVTSFWRK